MCVPACICGREFVARCWYKHTGPVTANKRVSNDEKDNSEPGKLNSKSLLQWSSCWPLKFIIPLPFTFLDWLIMSCGKRVQPNLRTGNQSELCRVYGLLSLASLFSGRSRQRWEGYIQKYNPFRDRQLPKCAFHPVIYGLNLGTKRGFFDTTS